MIGLKETDRLMLWALIQKRRELKMTGTVGNSEKILALQFGGAPREMGYPEQSEFTKRFHWRDAAR
jgi:hypothetical protein